MGNTGKKRGMSRSEFAEGYASFANIPKYKAKILSDMFFDYLTELFKDMDVGEMMVIVGFGTFEKKRIKSRKVGKIHGEGTMITPESSKIVFRQSKNVDK